MRPVFEEDAGGVASPRSELCYRASDRGRKAACCFHVLLDHDLDEVIEFYPSREAAEAELAEILHDEPGWVEKLELVVVDFWALRPQSREFQPPEGPGLPVDARSRAGPQMTGFRLWIFAAWPLDMGRQPVEHLTFVMIVSTLRPPQKEGIRNPRFEGGKSAADLPRSVRRVDALPGGEPSVRALCLQPQAGVGASGNAYRAPPETGGRRRMGF